MKKIKLLGSILGSFLMMSALFTSCESSNDIAPGEVSTSVLAKLKAANFSTNGVVAVNYQGEPGYVVEGDIFLTETAINELKRAEKIPNTEQYHTNTIVKVNGARTITVSVESELGTMGSNAIDAALDMYNSQNLDISFQRVAPGGRGKRQADIAVTAFFEMEYSDGSITAGRAAGFPTRKGDPAKGFGINTRWVDTFGITVDELAATMAHEIGHCIGLRHTDYMTRESCWWAPEYNEGSAGVGANHVPGTPTGSEDSSLMQACGDAVTFNNHDKVALDYLY